MLSSTSNQKISKKGKIVKFTLDLNELREHKQIYDQKKEHLDKLIKQKDILEKQINTLSKSVTDEKNIINQATLNIDKSDFHIPNGLSEEEQINVKLLVKLRDLIINKYSVNSIHGEYNPLISGKVTLAFSKGQFVHGQLACQPALNYFKGIKECTILHTGSSPSSSVIVTLTISACNNAIRGLELLKEPTHEEKQEIHKSSYAVRC